MSLWMGLILLVPLFFLGGGCCCPGDEEEEEDPIESDCCPVPIPFTLYATVSLCCCESVDIEMNYDEGLGRWVGVGGNGVGECVSDPDSPCDPPTEGVPLVVHMACNSEEGQWRIFYQCLDNISGDLSISNGTFECDPVEIEFTLADDSGESPSCCCECTGPVTITVRE